MKPGSDRRTARRTRLAALAVAAAAMTACTSARAEQAVVTAPIRPAATTQPATTESATTEPPTTTDPATTEPVTTEPAVTEPATTEPEPTEPATTEPPPTEPETTEPTSTTAPPSRPGKLPALPALAQAFASLAAGNAATSLTVIRDHVKIFGWASGATTGGAPMTSDSPLVLASVSKLVTALTIARLAELHQIDVSEPMPWDRLGIAHDPAWNNVTVRELLDHTAGMPKVQASWLNQPGSCAIPLAAAIAAPPTGTRGKWAYSNGNYCALGLLIEAVTGQTRAEAADSLIFDPIGTTGPHLTTDGLRRSDGPYIEGVARLERLGGAGTWLASTDDVAAMLDAVTPADRDTLRFPGIITDQYGWGHTGTVDGAKACAWVLEGGRTVITAIVAGNRPATGGKVCDTLVPALAADLGIWADKPIRIPD